MNSYSGLGGGWGEGGTLLVLLHIWESGSECSLYKITNLVTILYFKSAFLLLGCRCYFGRDPYPRLCYLADRRGGILGHWDSHNRLGLKCSQVPGHQLCGRSLSIAYGKKKKAMCIVE